ncbi:hypothetical protein GCM10008018_64840 [Paenibacillus marchantiophytorum]|uniref:DUF3231 family protein n=1 Tax=Paenibacillus marchantiophytorum TaxID=1619310 RepID=A0ABQ1FH33_9BACL|nr:DUF3231 family protein [Paenibacillus marchantiophytorum]GGA10415.1 hypothetical protein GCM10008018_64840 [Paenibacillus marchantiophytorum]
MTKTPDVYLSASEHSVLWATYMNDTMSICGIQYFLKHAADEELRTLLVFAEEISHTHIDKIKKIYVEANYPVPQGFTESDVNLSAPRLFSDTIMLDYMLNMAKLGLNAFGIALSHSEREDTMAFFSDCLMEMKELHNRTKVLAQKKGLYVRSPQLPTPTGIEFVHKQSFLGGLFSEKRPLIANEISNLTYNISRNVLGKALIMGFSQVAKSEDVQKYFIRGRDIAQKQIDIFSKLLNDNYLPTPMIMDSEVTDSQIPPFSEKLMMFHIAALTATGIGQYGISVSQSPRRDIAAIYTRLAAEIGHYAEDGANIMIANGWMEKPPHAADREALAQT